MVVLVELVVVEYVQFVLFGWRASQPSIVFI